MKVATLNVQNMRLRHGDGGQHLDGARDDDIAADRTPTAPMLDAIDRRLTARLLGMADADVVALQEVFDRETLDHFHDRFLLPEGVRPYPRRICLPGNDGRGLDVALMSRLPVGRVESHARLMPRDLGLADGRAATTTSRSSAATAFRPRSAGWSSSSATSRRRTPTPRRPGRCVTARRRRSAA